MIDPMLKQTDGNRTSGEGQTLTGRAFDLIRADILQCRLAPDARLRMEDLRERYGMGLSPLREALMRLEAEGLVRLEQKKGFRVAPVSRAHLMDIGRLRKELECLALSWAVDQGDVNWEAEIVSAFHRLSRQSKTAQDGSGGIDEEWNRRHRAFHLALVAACGSPVLIGMLATLYDQAERYVALSVANRDTPRDDVAEHNDLMDAALGRERDRLAALCRRHVDKTTDKVAAAIARFEQNEGVPIDG